jgi:hypothetical protein
VPDHRTVFNNSFSRTSFIILENRASIDIEQFGNLRLTFLANSNRLDGLGLLGRGELIAATTIGASTGQTVFGPLLIVFRSGTLWLRSSSTNWSVQAEYVNPI